MFVNARSASDALGRAAIAWQRPDEDADSPPAVAEVPGVAGRLAAGKHAVSRSAMRAVIDSHGRLDVRRERTDLLAITDPRVRPSLANSDRGALP
jgi:hypothetical protein